VRVDSWRTVVAYAVCVFNIIAGWYALVLYEYELQADVRLLIGGAMTASLTFIFQDQVSNRTRNQQQSAFTQGLDATPNPDAVRREVPE
jgi:hypothetical protein